MATNSIQDVATTVVGNENILPKIIAAILPLVIVIYYMYQDNTSYLNLFMGILITFLIGLVAFLCGCNTMKTNKKMFITLGIVILYAVIATMTSVNIKKLSKFRYFWVNSIVQYSLFLNIFILLLLQNKK
jgi:hypothetical protein